MQRVEKQDIYTRITNEIVSHLEHGVRPWVKPWNAEHAAGANHAASPPQREALQRHQCAVSVGQRDGTELRGSHLDDR
jgi:antirestriction protein ArdC